MFKYGTAMLVGMFWIAGSCLADPPEGYSFLRFDEGVRLAREQDRMVFVYFGRHGCGYCDKTNKEAFSVPAVRERYTANYVLVYVDAESGSRITLPSGERITERELGPRYKAFVSPVFAFLEPDGRMVMKQAGMRQAADFLAYADYIDGRHYKARSFKEFLAGGDASS